MFRTHDRRYATSTLGYVCNSHNTSYKCPQFRARHIYFSNDEITVAASTLCRNYWLLWTWIKLKKMNNYIANKVTLTWIWKNEYPLSILNFRHDAGLPPWTVGTRGTVKLFITIIKHWGGLWKWHVFLHCVWPDNSVTDRYSDPNKLAAHRSNMATSVPPFSLFGQRPLSPTRVLPGESRRPISAQIAS